jgi:hypothetical protein
MLRPEHLNSRLKESTDEVKKFYSRLGYLDMDAHPEIEPDQKSLTVSITLHVTEGKQYIAKGLLKRKLVYGRPTDPDSLIRLGIYPVFDRSGIKRILGASDYHLFQRLAGSIIHESKIRSDHTLTFLASWS